MHISHWACNSKSTSYSRISDRFIHTYRFIHTIPSIRTHFLFEYSIRIVDSLYYPLDPPSPHLVTMRHVSLPTSTPPLPTSSTTHLLLEFQSVTTFFVVLKPSSIHDLFPFYESIVPSRAFFPAHFSKLLPNTFPVLDGFLSNKQSAFATSKQKLAVYSRILLPPSLSLPHPLLHTDPHSHSKSRPIFRNLSKSLFNGTMRVCASFSMQWDHWYSSKGCF